jgi:hypothetical protein
LLVLVLDNVLQYLSSSVVVDIQNKQSVVQIRSDQIDGLQWQCAIVGGCGADVESDDGVRVD